MRYLLLILFLNFVLYSCMHTIRNQEVKKVHDVESIIRGFNTSGDTCRQKLFKEFDLAGKNLNEIIEMYGTPDFEFVDTLLYGNLFKDTYGYYYPFRHSPLEIDTIPELILHGCKWQLIGNKAIVIYFVNNIDNQLRPIYAKNLYYTEDLKPFWLLDEHTMTLQEVIDKRGNPQKHSIEKTDNAFGTMISFGEDICPLDPLPHEILTYSWAIDSGRSLFLYYKNSAEPERSKPIWGFQCSEETLMYE